MTRKIMVSLLVIAVTAVMVGAGTFALFNDTETSAGNTFAAGTMNLHVNGKNDPVGAVVTFENLAPCVEQGPQYVYLKNVGTISGKAYLHITGVTDADGENPESEDPNTNDDISTQIWVKITYDGQTVKNWTLLSDLVSQKVSLGNLPAGEEHYVDIHVHLDGNAGNTYQGDMSTATIEFGLEQ